ncbi:hypothetical protein D3C84_1056890 [compost metagenome]
MDTVIPSGTLECKGLVCAIVNIDQYGGVGFDPFDGFPVFFFVYLGFFCKFVQPVLMLLALFIPA